jgi:TolB protein
MSFSMSFLKRFIGAAILVLPVLAAMALTALPASADEAEVYITTKKGYEKISVVVPDFIKENSFTDNENRDVKMADILSDDLGFSGYFDVKRVKEIKGDVKDWSSLGVSYVVQGGYSTDGRELYLSVRVLDALSGRVIFKGSYPKALRVMRQKVHMMSDDVIYRLSGEKGVSSTKIAFISDMTGNNELYVSDYDGHDVFRLTRDESTCLLPAWSPAGGYITYTSYKRNNPDLWWVSSNAKSRGMISFYEGLNTAASWSPDGSRLALALSKDGNSEIYTMNRDGTGLKRLTFNRSIDTSPSWSPNGREIAFNSDRGGSPQIYIMDADGSNVRRISYLGGYCASPAWSPAGDRIAYVSRENNLFNIYLMNVDGSGVVRLTYNQGHNENPSWSPDAKHIVFSSTRSGNKTLYTMDPDGSNVRWLNIPGNVQTPAWSPYLKE